MTTMAVDDPPLRRLFDRLDFAPRPAQARLAELLAQWEALRDERVAPRSPFARSAVPPDAFLFARTDGENDYVLERASSSLESVLGSADAGDTLAAAPNPRQAARLRRLFDAVIKAGEPVLAEFVMEGAGEGAVAVDLLAAPMADAEGRIGAIFGGCELRAISGGAARRPSRARELAGPVLFALANARALADSVAARLGTDIAPHEERDFEDGEHKIRPTTSVRDRDVYVFADLTTSPGQSVNDKLCKLHVLRRRAEAIGGAKRDRRRAVSVLRAQGAPDQAARSRRHALSRADVRGGRRRLRDLGDRPQPRRVPERVPLPRRASRYGRAVRPRPGRAAERAPRRRRVARSGRRETRRTVPR